VLKNSRGLRYWWDFYQVLTLLPEYTLNGPGGPAKKSERHSVCCDMRFNFSDKTCPLVVSTMNFKKWTEKNSKEH
jgi:hypothetical protein